MTAYEVPDQQTVILRKSGLRVVILMCMLTSIHQNIHSDALALSGGGTIRPHDKMDRHSKGNGPSALHAGSVPLLWMRREAAANGLVFKPEEFAWSPEDIDFGTRNTMTSWWRILEILPIRHQISFSGLGKHKRR